MSWTVGVPRESGIYEIRGVKDGVIQNLRFEFEKISSIVNWTITPEGGFFRCKFDYRQQLQDWVLVDREAATKPDQDIWTSELLSFDRKDIAYRKYNC